VGEKRESRNYQFKNRDTPGIGLVNSCWDMKQKKATGDLRVLDYASEERGRRGERLRVTL